MKFKIIDIINSVNAVTRNQGIKVYLQALNYITKGFPVILSFEGLENISSSFCFYSIGNLHTLEYDVDKLLKLENIKEEIWQFKINEAIELAKDPEKLALRNKILDDLINE